MVLENIIKPKEVKKNPKSTFILGMIYSIIAIILAYFIFPSDPSLSVIFLTTLAALPLLINVLMAEEEETIEYLRSKVPLPLIGTHLDVFLVFTYMFFGFLLCYLIVYIIMPASLGSLLFSEQINTIKAILGSFQFTGALTAEEGLRIILFNNFKVLTFAILFSFLYGAGAIFILAWNSSILAVAMGNLIRSQIAKVSALSGAAAITLYFQAGTFSVLRYFIHGIPEIFAYFLGAIAGGIISAAVVKHDYRDPNFYEIIMDAMDLIALACLLLIIGAILEVSVTPLLFSKI